MNERIFFAKLNKLKQVVFSVHSVFVKKKKKLCDFASLRLKYLLSPSKKTGKRPLSPTLSP